ncbi:transcriptional regulator, GntR family [Pseudonocardia ammonioxydans]|uniref:Transcriptional regulator, GntR family n=1 Tax=Pseudonocardia ammonioxydans TaxID=260086 RepID=A0A1I5D4R8_PSUAM|nr:GntR family transcriptional regulator [Pseudonocardia ammonioxydans]SFN94229.1 transcriptional regulator, GntR family [Pseudonocardia ammonioxydans]
MSEHAVTAGPGPVRRTPGRRLWEQLLTDLRRRLDADEFIEGFPGELALVEEYGVSRHTVRQAVKVLRDEGLVVGTRGRPSRRAEPVELAQRLGALYSLHESVLAMGLEQRSVVRSLDVVGDGVVAARLGLEESTPLVHLERLRLAGGEPLALDRVWLPHELAAPLLHADFSTGALYERYAELCGVALTGGEETIQPVLPTPAEHRLLGGSASTAAFAIRRLGTAKGRPVEWRQTLVRGDRFVLRADFADAGGYQLDLLGSPGRSPGSPEARR